ncbi:FMN reductase [Nocardia sp. NBC_00511]|uniref:FMN reductase n=1 Tax=Nocardia sp. NBC_00511 TaxID=2903591 RepID=UPI0030E5BE7B
MTNIRISVISAGLSQPSTTRLLADRLVTAADTELTSAGRTTSFEIFELRDYAHDLVNKLLTGFPSGQIGPMLDQVTTADGLIVVTPVFNASYSGLFKMFFDVLPPDSLNHKPILIGATAGTERHSLALDYVIRPMFCYLRAAAAPTSVFAASEDWGPSREQQQGELSDRITRAAVEFSDLIVYRRASETRDPYTDPIPFSQLLPDVVATQASAMEPEW